ncbi:MAG: alpha-(1-_3)-arabinofuranosyltransferase family protein [Propionibacteriales bacterium]|nr:alpha-(1->3)-arabinofuranosyltransferase family protein [Propionibacteriales bacterium]
MSSNASRAAGVRGSAAGRAHYLVLLTLGLFSFLQRPGSTTFDTKFDLTVDPGAFLAATLHLWNPELSFGELQNQAYGYLFPQGTFFLAGDVLGVPDWIVQRSWSALILVVAYDGARRLFRAWRPTAPDASDTPTWLPIVAGLAYAFSPRLLGLSGVLTAEILPTAVLPWVLLPLVQALRGRISPRLGGLLSGVAVLGMGGVNAVEVLAALPLPALVLAFSLGSAVGRRLAAWWVGAVALACAWWMLPLLVLGKYSPPFLDYIETAAATTNPLGWTNATRGADHWLAFIKVGGQPWWPGAFELATAPVLIGVTALVAALSLAGVFHPRMPGRVPLGLSVLLGLVLLTVAHSSTLGSPLSGPVAGVLDGALAPLRNVHKVDPLVRLPLALGFAHAAGLLAAAAASRAGTSRGLRLRLPQVVTVAVPAIVVGLLLVSAQPMFDRTLRKPGWDAVPQAWEQATDYLAEHAAGRRTLVLPGSGFGQQTWGWTIDEPIQPLARSPWVSRSQVPLVPGPTIRFLDSIEERIVDGRGSRALADVLARSGVGFVVVRRDLDRFASGAPSTSTVDQAIRSSPGLVGVAGFGSTGIGDQRAITVYRVARTVDRVEAVDADAVSTLVGGPEDVITALEAGSLAAREPVLIEVQEKATAASPDLVADGYRLRERQFGRLRDSLSQIMTTAESYRNERRAHDYPGVLGAERIAAQYPEIRALSASSSSGYADTLGPVRPELGPYSAVDGVPDTYWRSAPLESPAGQWVQVELKEPQPLPYVDVNVGVDGFSGLKIRRIRLDAGGQVSEHVVDPATGVVRVTLSGAPVSRIRVTVLDVFGDPEYGVVAVREIGLPGLELGRSLAVPSGGADAGTDFVFRAAPERRACVTGDLGADCDADAARPAEESAGLFRTFRTGSAGSWTFVGTVTPRSSPATAALLLPLRGQLSAVASSVLADDPSVSAQFAVDADPTTSWRSARGGQETSLELRWSGRRTLSRLQVIGAGAGTRSPASAVIEADGQRREVEFGPRSLGFFEALRTDHLTITFPGSPDPRSLGIAELRLVGLEGLEYQPQPAARTGAPCGFGPPLLVDGRSVPTRVVGTVGDVLSGAPLAVVSCSRALELEPGDHSLSVTSTDRFVPTTVVLRSAAGRPAASGAGQRATEIRRWQSTDRAVFLGPGQDAILRIPENLNAGWRATLDGTVLEQVAVDGWQQGYRVPAGAGGLVHLVYTPDRLYRVFLLIGGIAGGLLLAGAALVAARERRRRGTDLDVVDHRALPTGPFGVLLLVVAWVAGGVPLLAGAALGHLLRQRPGARLTTAVVLVGGAGLVAAVLAQVDDQASWSVLDAVTGGAVGLLLASLGRATTRKDADG